MTGAGAFLVAALLLPLLLGLSYLRFLLSLRRRGDRRLSRVLVANLLLLLLLLSLLLAAGELYYRYLFDTTDAFVYRLTTRDWFRRHFHRNRSGFRDSLPYYQPRRQAPGPRLSFVGDSFTAGHGVANVEQRFANLIRARRPGWEVHTLARCGMETGHQLAMLRELLHRGYELDRVVLVYCMNDISDLLPSWDRTTAAITERIRSNHLASISYVYNTIYCRWLLGQYADATGYYEFLVTAYEGPTWQRQEQRLRQLHQLVETGGGHLSVVTFPMLQLIGREQRFHAAHERLARLWRELAVEHLDLLEVYQAAGLTAAELTVNRHDPHPNERAHEVAAAAMLHAAFLAEP